MGACAEALNDLRGIADRLNALGALGPEEGLQSEQINVVWLVRTSPCPVLKALAPHVQHDKPEQVLLAWQALVVNGLEPTEPALPKVAAIRDKTPGGLVPVMSTNDPAPVPHPTQRVNVWIDHARQVVAVLIRRVESVREWLRFDEEGNLQHAGPAPLSHYLGYLSEQLGLFLARLDSCERNDAGDYLLRDARAGNLGGMRVLWDDVVLLAEASIAKTLPEMTPDQAAALSRGEVVGRATGPTRNARPLADALRQLLFSILYNADGSWVSEIPAATVAKIRRIGNALPDYRAIVERSEGGATWTPTVSPDLLQRLEAGIAAVHSIGSNFDARMAQVGRVIESLGAPDDGDAPVVKLPTLKPWAWEAWKASQVGMTATNIAATLAKERNDPKITQPRVSEQIQRAKLHAEASGLAGDAAKALPQVGSRAPARTLDPAAAEHGKRTDGKAHHLRERERQKAKDGDDEE